ncbi:uncharacterized protein LOC128885474 [Hylaeus anthracinus]|uniref:uncharacterized protein LOC128885474 n=1 Tax=Hylaeus anthracinus TaxID=313031 RepID=UPI0023B9F3EC|nr:uncharacterized protein LOC128885474 [Hylaeus anthracinus]
MTRVRLLDHESRAPLVGLGARTEVRGFEDSMQSWFNREQTRPMSNCGRPICSCGSCTADQSSSFNDTICPSRSPQRICIVPPIRQWPVWKSCCLRKYNYPCTQHSKPRPLIRFNDFDLASQY